MPSLFVAHGAPMIAEDHAWMNELGAWASAIARPSAILIISAHWEARPVTLSATRTLPLVYDFYGFPERFYRTTYPAPGAPELARRLVSLLRSRGIEVESDDARGLDHGAYVPLLGMYPNADVPVLQMSLPGLASGPLLALGRAIAPLRDEGVLIVGSGFLTHNLRLGMMQSTPTWASEFDAWVEHAIRTHDIDALADFVRRAPGAALAHPTIEHYVPLLVAVGAAETEPTTFPITGFFMGSFTRRSVQFGA